MTTHRCHAPTVGSCLYPNCGCAERDREILRPFTDAQLVQELRRRGRLRVVGDATIWYNDLVEDERYMEAMRQQQLAEIVRLLDNALCVRYKERVVARDTFQRPVRTARYASLMILAPEGVDNGESN